MRIRRLSAFFWLTCFLVIVIILYVMSDLSLKLENIRPHMQSLDDSKWSTFESKLRHIEDELNQHHAVVGEIKSAVNHIVENTPYIPQQIRDRTLKLNQHHAVVGEIKSAVNHIVENTPQQIRDRTLKLNQHHAVVGEIKSAVNHIVENTPYIPQQIRDRTLKPHVVKSPDAQRKQTWHEVEETKSRGMAIPKVNLSQCALRKETLPKTDVQMLSIYSRIHFDDVNGGVWKQGWNIEYIESQWNRVNPLKVFIVPHSHNDPGWIKTFENYYKTQTKAIFTNMIEKLNEVPGRKFIWCETSFLALWWSMDATDQDKATFKRLLNSGNIEIVTGGWVMNDEANSHFISIIQQLTTGHQWLLDNLQYIPKNHWSIDPFGYSSSQPYLLKLSGFHNSVIQRVHYRIKKELAMNKQLEFKWRQLWDVTGSTDMFTHVMPFYSYDIPHTCGPDPKVCCQFDFKRLPGNGVPCPWGVAPLKIIQKNVQERATLILDQWRKKAQLFRSNVVLIPLGDDFRYDRANEWNHQYRNYEALIDFINNDENMHAQVQFGTLKDYFQALHEEVKSDDFPVLSGDFFTYADRNQHYWSGYYTSRPFYKRMDRVLLGYVRAAESITAQLVVSGLAEQVQQLQLRDRVEAARRALALFQHHDGVTGTSRNDVREDYAKKMRQAIKYSQSAIQQAAYYLLKQPTIKDQNQEDIFFDVDDIWRRHNEIPTRITIALDVMSPSRKIVLYNALNFKRTEILTLLVTTPHVVVFNPEGDPILAQVSPVVASEERLGFAANKYQVCFPATVPALALTTYTVSLRDPMSINKHTMFSKVRVYNADYWSVDLPKMFPFEQPTERLELDISLTAGNGTRVVVDKNGLLKAVTTLDGSTFPLAMDFVTYDSHQEPDNNSGAYLFMPSRPGRELTLNAFPEMVVVEGPYKASAYSGLKGPRTAEMLLAITVYNNPALPQTELEVSNTILIDKEVDDLEVSIRFASRVQNGDVFYTDLNGMQMIKRRYLDKLPLQANWYPLPAAAYIEDGASRLTLLTSTPLGVAALQSGQIEVMQDRRLSHDDNRGLSQGVLDNLRTRHTFRLLVEPAATPCQRKVHPEHGSGQLTLGAHISAQTLLQPLVPMHYTARDETRPGFSSTAPGAPDVLLASYRAFVTSQLPDGTQGSGIGLVLQRVDLEVCYGNKQITNLHPPSDGAVQLEQYVPWAGERRAFESSLTFSRALRPAEPRVTLCPQEVKAVFINDTRHH